MNLLFRIKGFCSGFSKVCFLIFMAAIFSISTTTHASDSSSSFEFTPSDTEEKMINVDIHSRGFVILGSSYSIGGTNKKSIIDCMNLYNSVLCRVVPPVIMKISFLEDDKFFKLRGDAYGICYAGKNGVFCDSELKENQLEFSILNPGYVIPKKGQNIELKNNEIGFLYSLGTDARLLLWGKTTSSPSCINGSVSVGCLIKGPSNIKTVSSKASEFIKLRADQVAFCYVGPRSTFCELGDRLIKSELDPH